MKSAGDGSLHLDSVSMVSQLGAALIFGAVLSAHTFVDFHPSSLDAASMYLSRFHNEA